MGLACLTCQYDMCMTCARNGGKKIEKPKPKAPVAPPSTTDRHFGVVCDNCRGPVIGARFKCLECADFDLCAKCEAGDGIDKNTAAHMNSFVKIRAAKGSQLASCLSCRSRSIAASTASSRVAVAVLSAASSSSVFAF